MINTADTFRMASSFETQSDLGNDTQLRQKAAGVRPAKDVQGSWLKRAAGLTTLGLLAAEGAYGRALSPLKDAFAGTAAHRRALLQDCSAATPAMGTANATWLQSAGPYANAVATGQSWVPTDAEACPPPYPLELAYAFDTSGDILFGSEIIDPEALDADTQSTILRDFDQISGFVGLTFIPYDNATMDSPNLAVLRNTDVDTTIKHWYAEGPGFSDGVMSRVVYTEPAGNNSAAERLAGLGYTLGLKGIGAANAEGLDLPVGNFGDTALSSVSASTDNACWPVSRLGPLDLAFLAARHGLSPLLPEIEAIELDATYGTGGLLLSPDGFTTLAVSHPGRVTISLRDDGSSATHIGDSVILLAPGSVAGGADASATQGAWLIGNDAGNVLVGSPFDDFFSPGANATAITLGAGADAVLVDDTMASSIAVEDFNPLDDSIRVTPNAALAGQPAMQIVLGDSADGATLTMPGGASISLRNLTAADLPDLSQWVFSGVPDTLDAYKIDLCQGIAPAPAAPAPAPATQAFTTPAQAPAPTTQAPVAGPASPPSTQTGHHGHSHAGAIAGGVIGGVAGVALLGTLGWCVSHRRRIAGNRSQPHNRFQRFADVPEGRRDIQMRSFPMPEFHRR